MNKKSSSYKQVLVTGGAGFIGSHLCESLLTKGFRVTAIDNLSTGKMENILPLMQNPHFHFHQDSIFNSTLLNSLIENSDLVFHLAAAVGVKLIMENTLHTIEANILGTEGVLRAALQYRKPVFLASSSEVYGKSEPPFCEDQDIVLGSTQKNRWAYAASKMIDEFLALAYYREKNLPVVLLRFFNTIGTRQSAQYGMVVPRFIQQALRGENLTVYGDGEQSRCFCDVEDVVLALMDLMECPEAFGEVFNIGSSHSITMNQLAEKILSLVKNEFKRLPPAISHLPYHEVYSDGFEDIRHRQPSIEKIQKLTGWKPQIPLEESLRRIVKSLMKDDL